MAITSTTNEAKHGNRTTRAKQSHRTAQQTADNGPNGSRDSTNSPQAGPASRPASDRRPLARSRSEAQPIAQLTIDLENERVIEAVAHLLLDLTRHKFEGQTKFRTGHGQRAQPLAVAIADAVGGRGMIHRSDNLKTAAICCGDHQAAASATPVIFGGIDADHRIPAARAVGSPGPRRSLVLLKPAIQG